MTNNVVDYCAKTFNAVIYLKTPIVGEQERIEVVIFYPYNTIWDEFIQKTLFLEVFYPAKDLDFYINTNNILAIEKLD